MSVINEMLRDLDRRHGQPPPIEVGTIHVVAPTTSMSWRVPLLIVIVIAVIAGRFGLIVPRLQHTDVAVTPSLSATVTSAASESEHAATPAVVYAAMPELAVVVKSADTTQQQAAIASSPQLENKQSDNGQPGITQSEDKPVINTPPANAEPTNAASAPTNTVQPLSKQISQSPEALADAAYRHGAQMLQQGRPVEAEREFANALALNPHHVESAAALAQRYLADARTDAAAQLLVPVLVANPDALELRLLSARVQMQSGDTATALQTLRARNPDLQSHSDYYAVMAALEQQHGQFHAAAEHYRALLNVDASRAGWWLGFALAQENLGVASEAVNAYRRALALNDLPAAARDFAQQRLRALE